MIGGDSLVVELWTETSSVGDTLQLAAMVALNELPDDTSAVRRSRRRPDSR
jgi:hypothetical protein